MLEQLPFGNLNKNLPSGDQNKLLDLLPDGNRHKLSPKLPEKHPSHHKKHAVLSQFAIKFDLCHENPSLCNVTEQSECNDCSFVTKPHNFPDRSVLMGSFHQGHSQFGNVRNK